MNSQWDTCLTCGLTIPPTGLPIQMDPRAICHCSEAPRVRRRASEANNSLGRFEATLNHVNQMDSLREENTKLREALKAISKSGAGMCVCNEYAKTILSSLEGDVND